MRFFLIFIYYFCLQNHLYANSLESSLDVQLSNFHSPGKSLSIQGVFILSFNQHDKFDLINKQFSSYNITVNNYKNFTQQSISTKLIAKYCTENVSPYLLSEILSHLSIYKYCLSNNLNKVLIINSKTTIKDSPSILNNLITELEKIDPTWDVLYTDVDYHNSNNGNYIIPQIVLNNQMQLNKQQIHPSLSKVFYRYGAASFVISKSGMKKILGTLSKTWYDLPFDQILLKIPKLKRYGINFDVITNYYKEKITNPINQTKQEIFLERPEFKVGEEFWIDPIELVNTSRFDVMAKYIYAKYHLNHYSTSWHVELYKEHIKKWNNFYEENPLKLGFADFQNSFHQLLTNLQTQGFDPDADSVPIDSHGTIINGSHRVASCLALNIPIKVKVTNLASKIKHSAFSNIMRTSDCVREEILDHMAYEYAKLKKNTYVVCLFPSAFPVFEVTKELSRCVEELLSNYGDIVYKKDISFNENGAFELIRLLYLGESWFGNYVNNFRQGHIKTILAFPIETFGKYPLRVYLYECSSLEKIREVKKKIRNLIQIGNDSLHINDLHGQTLMIASTLFNNNSIHFMNTKKLQPFVNFDQLFPYLQKYVKTNCLNPDHLCVDASAVLSAYGLRDCRDIDLLHKDQLPKDDSHQIDSHNGYLKYHLTGLDDILYNPNSYFFYQGIKFLNIDLLKKMKSNRKELKDYDDIQLINSL